MNTSAGLMPSLALVLKLLGRTQRGFPSGENLFPDANRCRKSIDRWINRQSHSDTGHPWRYQHSADFLIIWEELFQLPFIYTLSSRVSLLFLCNSVLFPSNLLSVSCCMRHLSHIDWKITQREMHNSYWNEPIRVTAQSVRAQRGGNSVQVWQKTGIHIDLNIETLNI